MPLYIFNPRLNCDGGHSPWYSHYSDIILGAMTSQITGLSIVYSTVYSGADQRKHQSSALLAFVRGIHRWSVNSPNKWPVTRKMFSFDDVIIEAWRYTIARVYRIVITIRNGLQPFRAKPLHETTPTYHHQYPYIQLDAKQHKNFRT